MTEYPYRIGRGPAQRPRSPSDTRVGMTSVLRVPNSVGEKTLPLLQLCELRWKKSGEIPTDGGHRVYFSGKEDKHEQGVGFLVHKDIVKSVIGCRPISSRLMTVRLRASPFNITIIQVYAPTSSYDDSEVDEFYRELQSLVNQTPKQDILVVQGD